jgi:hypothetical protein
MTNKDPMPKPTFASFAEAFTAAEDQVDRFKVDKRPTIIVGTSPATNYPGPGNVDPVPNEEPLGYSVDQMTPVGTHEEIQASIDRLRKSEDDGKAA